MTHPPRAAAKRSRTSRRGRLGAMLASAVLASAVVVAALPLGVWAHGGGTPQLAGAEAGPYRLYAWTTPDPWRTGEVHIDVAVAMPAGETEMPVTDAAVQVVLNHAANAQTLTLTATPLEFLNSFYYETDFELPEVGLWHVEIQVAGEEGSGSAGFSIEALPPRPVNWTLIGSGAFVLVTAIVLWAIWSRQDATSSPQAARRPVRKPATRRASQSEAATPEAVSPETER